MWRRVLRNHSLYIKEEVKEEESVDDHGETTPGESDDIVKEIKEEGVDDDSYCVQKIHNSEDRGNNTVDDS